MVKVVRFHESGGPEVLRLDDVPSRQPGPGEVRLKVEAIGLNRAEALFRAGQYLEAPAFPARIGYEAAGVVDAVGEAAGSFRPGDRVSVVPAFSMNVHGVYGEEAVVPASAVVRTPPGLTSVEAAAVWMQYLTAYGALIELGRLQAGDAVVIPAASSSVGLAAIQIARRVGATPIAVTRTRAKRDALAASGAAHVIVSDEEDVARAILGLTDGRGARIIFDPVAGPGVEQLADAAAQGGTIFLYGILSLQPTPFPLFKALAKGLTLRGYTLFEVTTDPDRLAAGVAFVCEGIAAGAFRPVIAQTFPLADIVAAHRYLESNAQVGKIVVTVGSAG
jgi:NADPH:quinone reductase-like Zn-dependent oxidoreductase